MNVAADSAWFCGFVTQIMWHCSYLKLLSKLVEDLLGNAKMKDRFLVIPDEIKRTGDGAIDGPNLFMARREH